MRTKDERKKAIERLNEILDKEKHLATIFHITQVIKENMDNNKQMEYFKSVEKEARKELHVNKKDDNNQWLRMNVLLRYLYMVANDIMIADAYLKGGATIEQICTVIEKRKTNEANETTES